MYLNILKKDLKRKKTMNVILLLFTILAAMFVSSGLSNVITVMNGTDYFLDKAGIGDYVVITQNENGGVRDILENSKVVTDYKFEDCYWLSKEDVTVNDKSARMKNNTIVIQSCKEQGIKFFTSDNKELKNVKKGEIYVTAGFLEKNKCKQGDKLRIHLEDIDKTYTIAGEIKDALLGSDMIGNTRLIINDEDYVEFDENEKLQSYSGRIFYIDCDNIKKLSSEITNTSGILFANNRDTLKLCYVMEMIVAVIILVLSVVMCIVSFVLLKFVITFTIAEEFREIGVMKALGIKNRKIRSLYIIKYFVMSVVGGVIGFFAGIPFGNMLIKTVSTKMVLGNDSGLLINICGAVLVIFIMSGFAYLCTAKIKKYTPLDAIRNGNSGERYGKGSKYSIRKTHFGNAFYIAVNDILSAPRRFLTIILSFFICSIFVFGVVLVRDTMRSDSLITSFGKKSDVYITDTKLLKMEYMSEEGNTTLPDKIKEMESDLDRLGISGKVSMEVWYKYPVTFEGDTISVTMQQNKLTKASEYEYLEGTAPQSANEIAITKQISKQLGAKIGDTVTIDFGAEEKNCVVTAYFQTLNQLGSVIKLYEEAPATMEYSSALMAFQIDFDEKVQDSELEKRIDKIKDFYGIKAVFDAKGYCDDCIGVSDTMNAVANLLTLITCIVVILVTVFMERSFISDETGQIALLKAIGFKNSFIIRWHVYRFMIVAVISELFAVILTYPVSRLWCDPIWNMMGAANVNYCFKPVSLLLIYPGIILLINFISVLLTALYTRRITSNDVRNIE